MPEQGNIPEPTGSETPVETTPTTETSSEVDVAKTDNISQLRTYAEGLKKDLESYKPSHEFLTNKFGSIDNAELASTFYGSFAGDDFDPDKFLEQIGQLSPQRAKQLTEKLSKADAAKLAEAEVERIFGGKPSAEELKLFKDWKEKGYGLGEGDDIPEAMKFDADGNPRTPEEIQFFRDLAKQVKDRNKLEATQKEQAELEATATAQAKTQEEINRFSIDRLKVLDKEFDAVGLGYGENDTAEQRAEKDFIRGFLADGIAGAFMKDVDGAKDYGSAVKHIEDGEVLLSRRFEPKIEAKLLDIFRGKPVQRLLKFLAETPSEIEEIPEINESGTSHGDTKPTGRVTSDDIYESLIKDGRLKV